jgi:hypothetical protein
MKAYVPKILMVDVNENYEMMVRKEKLADDARITFVLHRKNFDMWETVGLSSSKLFFDKPDFDLYDTSAVNQLLANIDQHKSEVIVAYEDVFMRHEDRTIPKDPIAQNNIIPMWGRNPKKS